MVKNVAVSGISPQNWKSSKHFKCSVTTELGSFIPFAQRVSSFGWPFKNNGVHDILYQLQQYALNFSVNLIVSEATYECREANRT